VRRDIVWAWTSGAGLEHCAVVADWQGRTLAVQYRLECDTGGQPIA
jgi:hypothetical protein